MLAFPIEAQPAHALGTDEAGRRAVFLFHPDPDLIGPEGIGRVVGAGVHRGIGGEVVDQRLEVHQQIRGAFQPHLR